VLEAVVAGASFELMAKAEASLMGPAGGGGLKPPATSKSDAPAAPEETPASTEGVSAAPPTRAPRDRKPVDGKVH